MFVACRQRSTCSNNTPRRRASSRSRSSRSRLEFSRPPPLFFFLALDAPPLENSARHEESFEQVVQLVFERPTRAIRPSGTNSRLEPRPDLQNQLICGALDAHSSPRCEFFNHLVALTEYDLNFFTSQNGRESLGIAWITNYFVAMLLKFLEERAEETQSDTRWRTAGRRCLGIWHFWHDMIAFLQEKRIATRGRQDATVPQAKVPIHRER